MSVEENRAFVAAWLGAAGERDMIEALIAGSSPHVVVHSPFGLDGGLQLAQEIHVQLQRGFPDMTLALEGEVYGEDRAVIQFLLEGTNTGPILGLPPTNRKIEMPIALAFRVEQQRIVELWFYANTLAPIIQQRLGDMGLL